MHQIKAYNMKASPLSFQEKFTTRHELALLRVSVLMGLVMFGGMASLFYTQMMGVLSVSTQ